MRHDPAGARAPHDFVYLASQSPRRRELLDQLGIAYRMLLPDDLQAAEALEAERTDDTPQQYVTRATLAKAIAAHQRRLTSSQPAAPVLAADTTVTLDGKVLGKPGDAADALRILSCLVGRTHQVMTGVAVVDADAAGYFDSGEPLGLAERWLARHGQGEPGAEGLRFALCVSSVSMAVADTATLQRYIGTGEPFGKAGAYGIQGQGAALISSLHGSYSGVMGLPLFETAALLRQAGLNC